MDFEAPLARRREHIRPEWLDGNGHMNVAYYIKAFEIGIDSYKAVVGLTLPYIEASGRSTVDFCTTSRVA